MRIAWIIFYCFLLIGKISAQTEVRTCATPLPKNPLLHSIETTNFRVSADSIDADTNYYDIPVVVHIIHSTASGEIGGAGNYNLSETCIQSQIETLNEDFRRIRGTRGFNNSPIGADIRIQFCLASLNKDSLPTSGIVRHYSTRNAFSLNDASIFDFGKDWPTDRYLNVYVLNVSSLDLGKAQTPDSTGLDFLDVVGGDSSSDAVLVATRAFGRIDNGITSATSRFNLGRTLTHEVGHWLGLRHTFGDQSAGCIKDGCEDTPYQSQPSSSSRCDARTETCSSVSAPVMFENYMDYSPDACMNIFTLCQKKRMRTSLLRSPRRKRMLNAFTKCKAVVGFDEFKQKTDPLQIYWSSAANAQPQIRVVGLHAAENSVLLQCIDLQGRVLFEQLKSNQAHDSMVFDQIPTLNSGLYTLRCTTSMRTYIQKIWPE